MSRRSVESIDDVQKMSAGQTTAGAVSSAMHSTGTQSSGMRSARQLWYMAIVLCLANIVSFIDRQSLPLLVDQIKADLQMSDTQMSFLIGLAFTIPYVALGVPVGVLVDCFPRRKVLASGIMLWSFATMVCGLANSYWTLFIGRVGIGAGETVVGPASLSLIRDAFSQERRGRAVAIWTMGGSLGAALALVGGGSVLSAVRDAQSVTVPILGMIRSWQLVLLCGVFITVPIALLMFTFPEPRRTGTQATDATGLAQALRYMALSWKTFLPLFFVNSITVILVVGHSLWTPAMFGRVWHLSRPEIGLTLGLTTLFLGGGSQFAAGWTLDVLQRKGVRNPMPVIGMIVSAVAFLPGVLMPLAPSANAAWALYGLYLLFGTSLFTIGTIFITRVSPPEMVGKITSIHFLWMGIVGTGLGATLYGLVADRFFEGPMAIAYSLSCVVGILSVVAFLGYVLLWKAGQRSYL